MWIAAGAVSLGDVMEREHVPVTGSVGQGGINESISCERRRHTYTFCFGFSNYKRKLPHWLHNIDLFVIPRLIVLLLARGPWSQQS